MKKVDITDKLELDGNPVIVIKGTEIEVNADVATVLQIMDIVGGDARGAAEIMKMYELFFSESEREKIDAFHLQFPDFSKLVNEAINIVTDTGEDSPGEAQIPATT